MSMSMPFFFSMLAYVLVLWKLSCLLFLDLFHCQSFLLSYRLTNYFFVFWLDPSTFQVCCTFVSLQITGRKDKVTKTKTSPPAPYVNYSFGL